MHDDERIGPDLTVCTDANRSKQGGRRSYEHVVFNCRMPLAQVFSRSTERDVVEHHAVVPDFCGFSDHDAGSVVNEETPADHCSRVDLNSRPEAANGGKKTWDHGYVKASME